MTYSGSGDVTAQLQEVNDNQFPPGPTPSSSNAGCEAADFAGFVPGRDRADPARDVHVPRQGAQRADRGRLGGRRLQRGPAGPHRRDHRHARHAGLPHPGDRDDVRDRAGAAHADRLRPGDGARQDLDAVRDPPDGQRLADTPWGDPNRVIVQGSHLDSVTAGPGINDNGSGSAYNLESAIQVMKNQIKTKNKIRFAWWGAEEFNLLGSQFYVDSLSDEEFAKIFANLNFDMIASPNFVRFVYDGDGSDTGTEGPGRVGRDRAAVRRLVRLAGPRDRADRVRRPLRLRPVHRPRRSRPAASSRAPRASRPPRRRPSTAASPARRTTAATTRPATRSAT